MKKRCDDNRGGYNGGICSSSYNPPDYAYVREVRALECLRVTAKVDKAIV